MWLVMRVRLLLAGLALWSGVLGANTAPPAFIDSAGTQVRIATPVQRIGALWFAHNEVLCMLGAASRIVATVDARETYPWLYRVRPALHKVD